MVAFACVIVCLTAFSWGRFLHHPENRYYPLMWPDDRHSDLWNYRGKMLHLERGAGYVGSGLPVFNYLAPAAFLYHLLLSSAHPVGLFETCVLGSFSVLLAGSLFLLVRQGLARWESVLGIFAIAVSFPIAFVIHRSNLEGFVWIAVTVSLCLFLRRWYTASAIFLAFAMSIKPFPIVVLLLFLARRQYRAAVLSVAFTSVLVLWGLAALGPGILAAYRGLQSGVLLYTQGYLRTFRTPPEQQYSHGMIDVMRVLYLKYVWLFRHVGPESFIDKPTPSMFPVVYAALAPVIAGLMLWRLRTMPALNQVLGTGIALTLLPPSAADYTLCSLYLPALLLGYFLSTEVRSGRVPWRLQHMLLLVLPCAALLSPLNLFGLWTGVARFVLLLALAAGALTLPLRSTAFDADARLGPTI